MRVTTRNTTAIEVVCLDLPDIERVRVSTPFTRILEQVGQQRTLQQIEDDLDCVAHRDDLLPDVWLDTDPEVYS